MKTLEMLTNFLFPSVCCFCGEITAYDRAVCPRCSHSVTLISGITCCVCGMEKGFCDCTEQAPEYKRRLASFYYEGLPKNGVWLLKYGDIPYIGRIQSAYMARQVKTRFHNVSFDMVTAVPMHRLKRRERGYNQAEMLACPLAKRLKLPYYRDVLIQERENATQHLQNRDDRAANVAGIYSLSRKTTVKGKTVLLVDDISTTGATLRECTRVLLAGGAKEVYCVVFCVTKPINA